MHRGADTAPEIVVSITPVADALRRDLWLRLIVAVVVLGAGLRAAQYLANRSYWHDEAFLVLNLYDKTAAGLLGRLDYEQAAPPLFLLAQRGMVVLLGESEYATRLLPLLFGIAALAMFARVSWTTLPPAAAAIAVCLFALSDRLIWHSCEAKQYSSDVAVAVGLLLLAQRTKPDESAARRLARVAAFATVAVWFSHPVPFVFGGISLALLPQLIAGRRGWLRYVALNLPVVASFVLLYVLSVQAQQNSWLAAYWGGDMADYTRWWALPAWLIRRTIKLVEYAYNLAAVLVLPLAMIGAVCAWRSGRRQLAGILVLPIGLTLLAAMLHRYPYGGNRLALFLAPGIFLLAAAGWASAGPWLQERWGRVATLVPLVVIGLGAVPAAYHLAVPRTRAHIRPAVLYIKEHFQSGDVIVLEADKSKELLAYWRGGFPQAQMTTAIPQPPPRRFWMVTSFSRGFDREFAAWAAPAHDLAEQRLLYRNGAAAAALFVSPDEPPRSSAAASAAIP